ncbi:MAG: type IV secretory system conjugative DNA transfer family protein, partial [Psychrosphaera sp.]|nr:type IV secretory system conjugative DNA transfer family protein [Psychrosphaera sp.]
QENIQTFLNSYQHFIDLYGFSLISSADHLVLAQSVEGEYVTLPNGERDKHVFILGSTGSGKSEAMLGFALQDIFQGRNGFLLDPFGGLSHKIAAFVMAYETLKGDFIALKSQSLQFLDSLLEGVHESSKQACLNSIEYEKLSIFRDIFEGDVTSIFPQLNVKLIDLSSKTKDHPYRINPFRPSTSLSIQDSVQLLLDAIAMEMGGSLRDTPQAAAILEGLFAMIAANGGGFGDILPTLNTLRLYKGTGKGNNLLPAEVLRQLQISNEPMLNNAADYIEKQLLSFSGNDFNAQVNSTRNRLNVLNNSKLCHSLFLTSETTFDIGDMVNSDDSIKPFVIMHIPCAEPGGSIAATYIYKLIEKVLRERTEKQKKNLLFLYADEFHKFLG